MLYGCNFGFSVWGYRFWTEGIGFRVCSSEFRVYESGFGV